MFTFTYYDNDAVKTTKYPDGEIVENILDNTGRLEKIKSNENEYMSSITYDVYGNPQIITYGNGVKTEYDYNLVGWISDTKTSKENYYINKHYNRDNIGYIEDITDYVNSHNLDFTYDPIGRLTDTSGYYNAHYIYDSLDRMTKKTEGTTTVNMEYTGKPTPFAGGYGNLHLPDIVNGQQIIKDANGNVLDFYSPEYNSWGRVWNLNPYNKPLEIRFTNPDIVTSFKYDGNGNRVKKEINDESTTYYFSPIYQEYYKIIPTDCQECIDSGYYYDSTGSTCEDNGNHIKDFEWKDPVKQIQYCCGDNVKEYYTYFQVSKSTTTDGCDNKLDGGCISVEDNPEDDACCFISECVYNGKCYETGDCVDVDGRGYIDNLRGEVCLPGNKWIDRDRDDWVCGRIMKEELPESVTNNQFSAWIESGEDNIHGEYNNIANKECCGDDDNEYFRCYDYDNFSTCRCCDEEIDTVNERGECTSSGFSLGLLTSESETCQSCLKKEYQWRESGLGKGCKKTCNDLWNLFGLLRGFTGDCISEINKCPQIDSRDDEIQQDAYNSRYDSENIPVIKTQLNTNLLSTENLEYKIKYYPLFGATAMKKGDELYFIHPDYVGSTSVITDSSGTKLNEVDYYPYGSMVESEEIPTERKFTGQILDDSTGLYFYNARYYDPYTGSFISADTVEGPNRYAYASNNPVMFSDPSGTEGMPRWKPALDLKRTRIESTSTGFLKAFASAAAMVGVGNQMYLMGGGGLGSRMLLPSFLNTQQLVPETLNSQEYKEFESSIYSDTNFDATTDFEFVESLTKSISNHASRWANMPHDLSPFDAKKYPSSDYSGSDLAKQMMAGNAVCVQISAYTNYLLGQQGIHSEYVQGAGHSFLFAYLDNDMYVVDPYHGVVSKTDEYIASNWDKPLLSLSAIYANIVSSEIAVRSGIAPSFYQPGTKEEMWNQLIEWGQQQQ